MIPRSASVNISRRFNLGDYESIEVSVFMCSDVEQAEHFEDVVEYLSGLCRNEIQRVLDLERSPQPTVTVQKYFMGKPVDDMEF